MSVVHILEQGKALCYFSYEQVPGKWPEGHRWVGLDQTPNANCKVCLDRVRDGDILPGFSQDSMLIIFTYGYDQFLNFRGSGHDRLRTPHCAQPYALEVGDILATGEKVLSPSRVGFHNMVYIHVSNHRPQGVWLSVPSRIALAFLPEDAPENIRNLEEYGGKE